MGRGVWRERGVLGKGRVLLWSPCRKDQVESRAGVSREEYERSQDYADLFINMRDGPWTQVKGPWS